MKKYNLHGGGFQHAYSSTYWKKPTKLQWMYGSNEEPETFYVDDGIPVALDPEHKANGKTKYGWILESRFISQPAVDTIKENLDEYLSVYKYIFTHHKELLILSDQFKWCPAYGTYIDDIKLYDKSKVCSMIASGKSSTALHRLRCDILQKLKSSPYVDIYGRDINPIDNKEDGLCDYMFSIAIENDSYETYYTEKILDCFATGTVPIYIGAPDIGDYFDTDGIINLTGTFDFSTLTRDLYDSKLNAIKTNLDRVRELDVLDDWIYNTYLS